MATNVTLIKFLGGEEVLGEVVFENLTHIGVKNAVRIVVIPDQLNPKTPQVGLAPYLQFSDDKELTINKNCVITIATPVSEFLNQYNSIHGGIQLATNKIITP